MIERTRNWIRQAVCCLVFLPSLSAAQNISVYVDAIEEVGQAMLVKHAGACQAIVPTHVVKDSAFISVYGRGNNPPLADAAGITSFGYDLSVMAIEGELANYCGPLFDGISRNIDQLLNEDLRAQANTVNPDGTVSRTPLTILDQSLTYLSVSPTYSEQKLMKGMSGSLVTSRGKPLGLLLSVNAETGVGKVIRMDRVLETISPYFRGPGTKAFSPQATATASVPTGNNQISKIAKWSAPAIDGQHRAQNLLATDSETPPWIASIKRMPETLVFSLGENSSAALQSLSISGQGLAGDKRLARQVEIMIDAVGNDRWRSLKVVTLSSKGAITNIPLAGRKAQKIMLRIHNNWGDVSEVGLGRVYIASAE